MAQGEMRAQIPPGAPYLVAPGTIGCFPKPRKFLTHFCCIDPFAGSGATVNSPHSVQVLFQLEVDGQIQ